MNFSSFDRSNLCLLGEASGKAGIPETLGTTNIFCYHFFLFSIFFFKLLHLNCPSSDCRMGKQ